MFIAIQNYLFVFAEFDIRPFVRMIAKWGEGALELLGVCLIVLLSLYALIFALFQLLNSVEGVKIFEQVRRHIIQGVLLGLEFLVAADIIHTVALELSFTSIGVLAAVVLIRTFLSFSLELEMTGYWPWQKNQKERDKLR